MERDFLLYGSTGATGKAFARLALENGLHPLLAGRNGEKLKAQAAELGLPYRQVELGDAQALDAALREVPVVFHAAGPYIHTFRPMLDGCLRTGTHYLDLTGELPVYEALAACDAEAKQRGIMLLPGVGIEVVATDCLALHLKGRLPSATHLALAFKSEGPAAMPPGTFKSMVELFRNGYRARQGGKIVAPSRDLALRVIDFGHGPETAIAFPYPDVFTAYYSTGIPNVDDYTGLPAEELRRVTTTYRLRHLLKLEFIRELVKRGAPAESTTDERAQTVTHVWGEVKDEQGRTAISRLHGPEAGIVWTSLLAMAVLRKVVAGRFRAGFATPALAYGPELVLETGGVSFEDLQ